MRGWLFLALIALAGCTEPEFALSGSLTEDRTQEDLDELAELAQQHGGRIALRESFPEQFTASEMESQQCEDLRAILSEKPYISSVGPCSSENEGASPY